MTTTVAPAPAPSAAPPPVVPTVRQTFAPATEVVQPTPPPAEAEAEAPAPAPRARAAVDRPAPARNTARRAPAAAPATPASPPAAEPAPAVPTAAEITPAPLPVAPPVAETPAETVPDAAAPAEPRGLPMWPLALIGLAVLALVGWLILSRRARTPEEAYAEPVAAEPIVNRPPEFAREPIVATSPTRATDMPYVQPEFEPVLFATPAARAEEPLAEEPERDWREGVEDPSARAKLDSVSVGDADKAEASALAAEAHNPAGRAALDFALRPIRAGTTEDDALVEFELTIVNTGDRKAEDVRTFAALATEGDEAALDRAPELALGETLTIAPGEARRIEARIALPRRGVHVQARNDRPGFQPILVIESRYHSGGGETGRTSAAFAIGTALETEMGCFYLDRRPILWDEVEAKLHKLLERA